MLTEHPFPFEAAFRVFNAAWPILGLLLIGVCLALTVLLFAQLIDAARTPRDPRDPRDL